MRDYTIIKKIHSNLPDCHPKKGYVNWWEYEWSNSVSKKAIRHQVKLSIKKEINEEE